MLLESADSVRLPGWIVFCIAKNDQGFLLNFSSVRHFKEDKSNAEILVWRVEKIKKVDFALGFCCLDALSSRNKENDEKKQKS